MQDFLRDQILAARVAAGLPPEPTQAELDARTAEAKAFDAQRNQRLARERAATQAAREALGQRLGLGVPCTAAHTIRLAQLSARSPGTGLDARGAVHLRLFGPYEGKRCVRAAGDYLCRKIGNPFDVSDQGPDVRRVNCPRCLEMLKKLRTPHP